MKRTLIALGVLSALGLAGCNSSSTSDPATKTVSSVEFLGMDAPSTVEQRADMYSAAKVKVTYSDESTAVSNLSYKQLLGTTDSMSGKTVGGQYDAAGNPLMDDSIPATTSQFVSNTPDSNSLLSVQGADAGALGVSGNPLFMVTHFEYVSLNNAGNSEYGKVPMTMGLTTIDQDKTTGALTAVKYDNIDMSNIEGLWIPCAGSLSPWNTHLGSEEYEPDARAFGLDGTKDPYLPMTQRYYGGATTANPYSYGAVPEVTVHADGTTAVVKHYALGRIARELAQVMPDQRTVYMGDDGKYTGLFMFVADTAADLSAGTLYAAKWTQTSAANGGAATLTWIKLGHASDAEIEAMIASNTKFSDIFDSATTDPADPTYTKVKAYNRTEWLKLKPNMERAAAFLETRRYAAYLGATTEFNKMEGVTVNPEDKKVYIAISYLETGMLENASDPVDDIKLPEIKAGVVMEMAMQGNQQDTGGTAIASDYVGVAVAGLVAGEDLAAPDAVGNTANDDKIANPDNLKYSSKMRTLFIGEDSGMHINNYVWAYNVDTGKLSRILSTPAGAEATGLQVVDNLNGFTYVMSNFQHAGDYIGSMDSALKNQVKPLVDSLWNNKRKAAIGYVSGIPAID
jgi:secreted PhoX family phosphatase